MNPTITSKREKMLESFATRDIEAFQSHSRRTLDVIRSDLDTIQTAFQKAVNTTDPARIQRVVLGATTHLRTLLWDDLSPCRAALQGDRSKAATGMALKLTQLYAMHDMAKKVGAIAQPRTHAHLPELLLGLQAIGWVDESREYCEYAWQNAARAFQDGGLPTNELLAWFSVYFTLGSRDLIAPTGIKEPDKPDSVYSMLLGKWKNPDPAEVSNTLLAYAERNVAETLLPQSKRPLDLERPDLLFIPYDVLAINIRRHAEGLAWVDIDDPRMEGWPVSTEKMPLVKDNVTWPIYVELCKLVGVEPMRTEKEIEVTVDPETLEIVSY